MNILSLESGYINGKKMSFIFFIFILVINNSAVNSQITSTTKFSKTFKNSILVHLEAPSSSLFTKSLVDCSRHCQSLNNHLPSDLIKRIKSFNYHLNVAYKGSKSLTLPTLFLTRGVFANFNEMINYTITLNFKYRSLSSFNESYLSSMACVAFNYDMSSSLCQLLNWKRDFIMVKKHRFVKNYIKASIEEGSYLKSSEVNRKYNSKRPNSCNFYQV